MKNILANLFCWLHYKYYCTNFFNLQSK